MYIFPFALGRVYVLDNFTWVCSIQILQITRTRLHRSFAHLKFFVESNNCKLQKQNLCWQIWPPMSRRLNFNLNISLAFLLLPQLLEGRIEKCLQRMVNLWVGQLFFCLVQTIFKTIFSFDHSFCYDRYLHFFCSSSRSKFFEKNS